MSAPAKVVAYQLSLLGDAPKPGKAWRRGFWQLTWAGLRFPVSDDAIRQAKMLTAESGSFDAEGGA